MIRERAQQIPAVNEKSTPGERIERITVTATEAQNEFGRVLDSATQDRVVVITRHNTPRAVLMSIDKFEALSRAGEVVLDTLTGEFDALLERMQAPKSRAAMRQAFQASPEEMGRAAVAAAKGRRGDG